LSRESAAKGDTDLLSLPVLAPGEPSQGLVVGFSSRYPPSPHQSRVAVYCEPASARFRAKDIVACLHAFAIRVRFLGKK
jgi:hypothetical protein